MTPREHTYSLVWYPVDEDGDEYSLPVECEFEYDPADPPSAAYPGYPARLTLLRAVDAYGVDQYPYMSAEDAEALEQGAMAIATQWE